MVPDDQPADGESARRTVTAGYFERTSYLSRAETATLLRDMADQLEAGGEVTIRGDDWRLPFAVGGMVEVEVELDGDAEGNRELELEFEFEEAAEGDELRIE